MFPLLLVDHHSNRWFRSSCFLMAIKGTTQPIFQVTAKLPLYKSSLPEMPSLECEEFLSPEKAARASMLKLRFAGLICKARQTLALPPNDKDTVGHDQVSSWRESYEEAEKLKKTTSSRPDQVDHVQRERREGDYSQFLEIKKRQRIDLRRDDEDDYWCYEKKRRCHDQVGMWRHTYNDHLIKKRTGCGGQMFEIRRKGDHELKRRQEIERQREAARIAINNMQKTVDCDNLGVMEEFKRLLRC